MTIENSIEAIRQMFGENNEQNVFQKYITSVRFPYYKNFVEDASVEFTFPLTFVVGGNGLGKSSFLHALFGAPRGNSISRFWYNTDLDPIKNIEQNRHCFIYSYQAGHNHEHNAEVLLTRIRKVNDPDYWETARPQKRFKMGIVIPKNTVDANKTRWKKIEKKVYYIDFRYALSAYDKYFYFGKEPEVLKKKYTKKTDIRRHSKRLAKVYLTQQKLSYYARIAEQPRNLDQPVIDEIGKIINKQYSKISILKHNLYDAGDLEWSVKFETKNRDNLSYSEAYAGSGEVAIVRLVDDILKIPNYSLVLIDEPETSIHPGAQRALMEFILEQIKKKKLQVIISTHSPDIIQGMPKETIKYFFENVEKKISIIENIPPENAFFRLGRVTTKTEIIVEDDLAKRLVEKVINMSSEIDAEEKNQLTVSYVPGGESFMKVQLILVDSMMDNNRYYIFDGDQEKAHIDLKTLTATERTKEGLMKIIECQTGCKAIKFPLNSNSPDADKIINYEKYLIYYYKFVNYLPKNTPEEVIYLDSSIRNLGITQEEEKTLNETFDTKEKIKRISEFYFESKYSSAVDYLISKWGKKQNTDYKAIEELVKKVIRDGKRSQNN